MAPRTLFLACCLVAVFAVASAVFSPLELALRKAIVSPTIKSFVLTGDLNLSADLPAFPDNKVFTLIGNVKGKKAKINGLNRYTIFKNSGNAVTTITLKNLIITGGKATFPAVQLGFLGTKLTVTDVDFVRNPQALFLTSVDAVITRSTFTGHTLSAISLEAEEGDPDKVSIVGSTFTGNKGESGGGVRCGKYTTLYVSGSKFIGNSVSYRGGAIRLSESSFGTISSSVFDGNSAADQGGAITVFNAGVTISGSTFRNNVAKIYGGALRVGSTDGFGAVATVSGSSFTGNRAGKGGAFVMDTNNDSTDINFCRTTFSKNTPNDGFILGQTNTILTKDGKPLPGAVVVRNTGAVLAYKVNPSCK